VATFLCTIQYGDKGHEVLLEVWLENKKAPGTTGRDEVETALREAAASGVAPEGWTVSVINWSHPRSEHSASGAVQLSQFDSLIRSVDPAIEERPKGPRKPGEEEGEEE